MLEAAKPAEPSLIAALTDRSATVRVAACEVLCRLDRHDPTLPVLTEALSHPNEWVRLAAAITLDHLGPAAKPAPAQLERAQSNKNQYVVRVAEHALSVLP